MKLLLDENLSPRLAGALGDVYPGTMHVTGCGLRGATDIEVWEHARRHGFVLVSKDADFRQRSLLLGSPPKVIWLRLGNCTTMRIDFVLRNALDRLEAFAESGESCLELLHPRV